MIYTDQQQSTWWNNLAEATRQEILQKMVERAPSESFCEFAQSLRRQHDAYMAGVKRPLSPAQISSIRKWSRD